MARRKPVVASSASAVAEAEVPAAPVVAQPTPPAAIAGTGNPGTIGVPNAPAAAPSVKPAGVSALDDLDEATPTVKKSKSSVPTVALTRADQAMAISQAQESIKLKALQKTLEDLSKGILAPIAAANQLEISRSGKSYVKSIRFTASVADPNPSIGQEVISKIISILEQGHAAEALALLKESCKPGRREVSAVVQCPTQFCKLDANEASKVEGLKSIFGTLYDRFFSLERSVEVTPAALTDEFTNELVALFKKHKYEKGNQYKIERVIKVNGLDEAAVMDPAVTPLAKAAIEAGHIKPFSPSLKEK